MPSFSVLQLQHDRSDVAVQRQTRNSEKLLVKAPLKGMVALQNIWHNNTMGHAQEGDELWPGSPLLKLFDPSLMDVEVSVGEPDGAVLVPGAKAIVHLDAFPEIKFTAHYTSASSAATAPLGMSVKNFTARFRLDQSDPHLLPDLFGCRRYWGFKVRRKWARYVVRVLVFLLIRAGSAFALRQFRRTRAAAGSSRRDGKAVGNFSCSCAAAGELVAKVSEQLAAPPMSRTSRSSGKFPTAARSKRATP